MGGEEKPEQTLRNREGGEQHAQCMRHQRGPTAASAAVLRRISEFSLTYSGCGIINLTSAGRHEESADERDERGEEVGD